MSYHRRRRARWSNRAAAVYHKEGTVRTAGAPRCLIRALPHSFCSRHPTSTRVRQVRVQRRRAADQHEHLRVRLRPAGGQPLERAYDCAVRHLASARRCGVTAGQPTQLLRRGAFCVPPPPASAVRFARLPAPLSTTTTGIPSVAATPLATPAHTTTFVTPLDTTVTPAKTASLAAAATAIAAAATAAAVCTATLAASVTTWCKGGDRVGERGHNGAQGGRDDRGLRAKPRSGQGRLAPAAAVLGAAVHSHCQGHRRQCGPHRARNRRSSGQPDRIGRGGHASRTPSDAEQRTGDHPRRRTHGRVS